MSTQVPGVYSTNSYSFYALFCILKEPSFAHPPIRLLLIYKLASPNLGPQEPKYKFMLSFNLGYILCLDIENNTYLGSTAQSPLSFHEIVDNPPISRSFCV